MLIYNTFIISWVSCPLANRDSEALIKLIIDYSIHTRLINPVAETNVADREEKTQQKITLVQIIRS